MSDIALRVEEISKQFQIAHYERYRTLREAITRAVAAPWRNLRTAFGSKDESSETFWALKNVSFDVRRGEVLGVIGRNGAGKSTLLKILSRITEPSEGVARISGRVGSLLEVGTGFHPELSGRENIYLNGAILGMRKAEIDRKFDEIVAFSEIERFIDTPVKHYSSGMYMRLAFSIAAHLESEILIVDEVLAVGDAAFQKKCMGKMNDVATCGRTILFVSHSLNAIEQLCTAALMLEKGQVRAYSSDVRSVTREYLMSQDNGGDSSEWLAPVEVRRKSRWLNVTRATITDGAGHKKKMPLSNDSDSWLHIEGEVLEADPDLILGFLVYAEDGTVVFRSDHTDGPEDGWPRLHPGKCVFRSRLPRHFLNEGTYRIEIIAFVPNEWIYEAGRNAPAIFMTIRGGLSNSPYWMERRVGVMAPIMDWSVSY